MERAISAAAEEGPDFDVIALFYQYQWGAEIPDLPDVSDILD